ncbi:MAG: protease inhibitor I42 family protein, partial [Acidimicrobiales bacterium]
MTTALHAADRSRGRGRSIRTLVAVVGLALVMVVAIACSGNESKGSTTSTLGDPDGSPVAARPVDCYTADQADPAGPLTVSIGAQFAIVLAAEPATGFSWQPTAPADPALLLTIGTEFRGAGEACNVATESQVLRYVGRTPGTAHISLHYSRPAASAPDDKTLTFTVNVVDPTTTTTPPPET